MKQKIPVILNKDEFNFLNHKYPNKEKSADIGKRAAQIIRYHFKHKYPECTFVKPSAGSDLTIQYENGQESIEIKGTADKTISWQKLKVSSQSSYDKLRNGLPLYRVTNVFEREPVIYILKYSQDFKLVPEKRWAVKAIK
jgi:hypothetical protein